MRVWLAFWASKVKEMISLIDWRGEFLFDFVFNSYWFYVARSRDLYEGKFLKLNSQSVSPMHPI